MRYALVGLGNIGAKRRELLGRRCIGTIDPYNTAADFKDLSELSPDDYDAAILAVPNAIKIDLVRALLTQGKHVLIEKPFLLSDHSCAQELANLAKAHRAICYTSYNHRFEPGIESIKSELARGAIGRIYHGRFFYGNGTVGNIVGTWREAGLGVVEDLGSHLIDLVGYLCGCVGSEFEKSTIMRHEAKCPDHCLLMSTDGRFMLEASYLAWKNRFEIDLYGEEGSIHLRGLCKWGRSELGLHERVRPSGVPRIWEQFWPGPDSTWQKDLDYFEQATRNGETSLENDWWISSVLNKIAASA